MYKDKIQSLIWIHYIFFLSQLQRAITPFHFFVVFLPIHPSIHRYQWILSALKDSEIHLNEDGQTSKYIKHFYCFPSSDQCLRAFLIFLLYRRLAFSIYSILSLNFLYYFYIFHLFYCNFSYLFFFLLSFILYCIFLYFLFYCLFSSFCFLFNFPFFDFKAKLKYENIKIMNGKNQRNNENVMVKSFNKKCKAVIIPGKVQSRKRLNICNFDLNAVNMWQLLFLLLLLLLLFSLFAIIVRVRRKS